MTTFLFRTLLAAAAMAAVARAEDPAPSAEPASAAEQQEAREKAFADHLSGSVLVGKYTTTPAAGDEEAETKPDRYEIARVSKLEGDVWLFEARYGDTPLPPLPLKVLWAGKTPVITMDDFTIPALGTFSFRVMIDGPLYAGTWRHDEKGGHMLGTIEKKKEAK